MGVNQPGRSETFRQAERPSRNRQLSWTLVKRQRPVRGPKPRSSPLVQHKLWDMMSGLRRGRSAGRGYELFSGGASP